MNNTRTKFNYIALLVFLFSAFIGQTFIRIEFFEFGISLEVVCLFLFAIYTLIINKKRKGERIILFLLVVLSLISYFRACDIREWFIKNYYIFSGLLVVYFFWTQKFNRVELKNILKIINYCIFFNAIVYYLNVIFPNQYLSSFGSGAFYGNVNDLSTVMSFGIMISVFNLVESRNFNSVFSLCLYISVIYHTDSKANLLGILIFFSLIIIFFVFRKLIKKFIEFINIDIFSILLTIVFIALMIVVLPMIIKPQYSSADSFAIRKNLILNGLNFFSNNWLLGIGIGNSGYYLSNYSIYNIFYAFSIEELSFHNVWIELLVENGIVMFSLTIFVFIRCAFNNLKKYFCRNNQYYLFISLYMISFIIISLSSSSILTKSFIWLYIGLISIEIEQTSNNEILFVTSYPNDMENSQSRDYSLASKQISDYIIEVLIDLGYRPKIISTSISKYKNYSNSEYLGENFDVLSFATFYSKDINAKLSYFYTYMNLLFYLLFNTERNQKVFYYHSTSMMFFISILKKIKKITLIGYIGELYQFVYYMSPRKKEFEKKTIREIDYIIASNSNILKFLGINCKDYMILHGSYKMKIQQSRVKDQNTIRILYSGVINKTKGAFKAIDVAKYLDERYEVRIIGFGEENEIKELKNKIEEYKKENYKCQVIYDGVKLNDEYYDYVKNFDIGLCIQDLESNYNDTSFPSKIVSYITCGLKVLSVKIESIQNSELHSLIVFSEDNPKSIANAIRMIDFDRIPNNDTVITRLDKNIHDRFIDLLN